MKRRDRILAAISHKEADRVPIGFDIFEPLRSQILKYYGVTGFTAYFAALSPEFRQLVVDRFIEGI